MTGQGTEVRTLLDRVLTSFTNSGVEWALLRGEAELATGRDVDLLVAGAHLSLAEEIVFEFAGVPLPQWKDPWHSMYILDVPGVKATLKLDIVERLIYSRELLVDSELERGCLERRVHDGPIFLLSPTDAFWTILLHCVLDRRQVREDQGDELTSRVDDLDRPSPGEEFFASLCPPDWSPDRAIDCVVQRDWEPLGRLGLRILSTRMAENPTTPFSEVPDMLGRPPLPPRLIDKVVRPTALTGALYRKAYRALGMVVVPEIFDLVEELRVDATVIDVTRRPGRCNVVLVVEDAQIQRLLPALGAHYRMVAGAWRRLGAGGLESVRVVAASEFSHTEPLDGDLRRQSLLLAGRSYCRLATPTSAEASGPIPRRNRRATGPV